MTAHLEKVSIFVDVQNIYYTCRQAYKRSFDYNKFWAQATEGHELMGGSPKCSGQLIPAES